jgi:hypothetical protein
MELEFYYWWQEPSTVSYCDPAESNYTFSSYFIKINFKSFASCMIYCVTFHLL